MKKYWKSRGILSEEKSGNPVFKRLDSKIVQPAVVSVCSRQRSRLFCSLWNTSFYSIDELLYRRSNVFELRKS